MSIRIICVNKAGGYHDDPHEAISRLGWLEDGKSNSGFMSRVEMHDWIRQGGIAYVQVGFAKAYLEARTNQYGTKYVRTTPDGTTADNLLSLPECA